MPVSFGEARRLAQFATQDKPNAIAANRCVRPVGCGKPCTGFRDEVSEKEYRISGLCQSCQDRIFGVGDND